MNGYELAKAIKATRGKIQIGMATPSEFVWVYAEKADLINCATRQKDTETGMGVETWAGINFLDQCIERIDMPLSHTETQAVKNAL